MKQAKPYNIYITCKTFQIPYLKRSEEMWNHWWFYFSSLVKCSQCREKAELDKMLHGK